MKVRKIDGQKPRAFEPITLQITLETEEEANDFYAVFNHTWVLDAAPSLDDIDDDVRFCIGDYHHKGFQQFDDRLKKIMKEEMAD